MTPRLPLSGPLGLSVVALLLAALFVLLTVPSLLVAAFGPGTGASEPGKKIAILISEHEKGIKESQDRFNGRSAFFRPPQKYIPPPPPPPQEDLPPPPPPPPAVPATYTGPSLRAILGEVAMFMPPAANEPPLYLKVGDTDPKSGLMLVSTNPPWSVHVSHKGGEYDIDLFKKTWEPYFTANALTPRGPVPGLHFTPAPSVADASTAPRGQADRIPGRNVATPVVQPLTTEAKPEPNAKLDAAQEEETDEDAEAEEAAEESGEEPQTEETDPEAPEDEGGEVPPPERSTATGIFARS